MPYTDGQAAIVRDKLIALGLATDKIISGRLGDTQEQADAVVAATDFVTQFVNVVAVRTADSSKLQDMIDAAKRTVVKMTDAIQVTDLSALYAAFDTAASEVASEVGVLK